MVYKPYKYFKVRTVKDSRSTKTSTNSTVTQNKRDTTAWISTEVDTTAVREHAKLHRARCHRTICLWNRRTRTAQCSGEYYLLSPHSNSLRFSVLVQTSPGTHPDSCKIGYQLFFPGVKAAGEWRWLPAQSRAKVKERTKLYLYSHSGPTWSVLWWIVSLPLLLPLNEDSKIDKCK
jgi:hypothetical protein